MSDQHFHRDSPSNASRNYYSTIDELLHADAEIFKKLLAPQKKVGLLCLLRESISQLRISTNMQHHLSSFPHIEKSVNELSESILNASYSVSHGNSVNKTLENFNKKIDALANRELTITRPPRNEQLEETIVIMGVDEAIRLSLTPKNSHMKRIAFKKYSIP